MTKHVPPPSGEPLESFQLAAGASPEQLFRAIGKLRKDARDEIDRLIRFLDETENHMQIDCEPEDEGDDAELEEDDPEEDDGLAEPSLGSLDGKDDQTAWAAGSRGDQELDPAESGIADYDGLLEQIGAPDWQGSRGGMI